MALLSVESPWTTAGFSSLDAARRGAVACFHSKLVTKARVSPDSRGNSPSFSSQFSSISCRYPALMLAAPPPWPASVRHRFGFIPWVYVSRSILPTWRLASAASPACPHIDHSEWPAVPFAGLLPNCLDAAQFLPADTRWAPCRNDGRQPSSTLLDAYASISAPAPHNCVCDHDRGAYMHPRVFQT